MSTPSGYRPHIDGLRGLAVLGVLLFHFAPTWVPGGFVGVDVFFVISGFLISRLLYRDAAAGGISLTDFYERRLRRILPAFVVTTTATWATAHVVLFPNELEKLAKSVVAGSLFAANFHFYWTSGYFADAAHELPLLHLWSLGIEEQFYILFPFVVIIARRGSAPTLSIVLTILLVSSLVASELMLRRDPSAAFYLLPFRAFELLIGAVLALPGVRSPALRITADAAIVSGLLMIAGAMIFMSSQTRFPGVAALIPCLGAALIIWGGEFEAAPLAKFLANPWLRFYGRISFSLYLIHWPLAVFARMVLDDPDPLLLLVGGIAASTALAWLSWAIVEQPFRRMSPPLLSRKMSFLTASAVTVALIASASITRASGGFPGRVTDEINEALAFTNFAYQSTFREGTCFLRPEQAPDAIGNECLPTSGPRVMLWGSSHIAQFFGGLKAPVEQKGYTLGQITGSACIPLINWDHPQRPNCRALNSFAIDWLERQKPDVVVMGGDPITDAAMLDLLDASIARLSATGIKVFLLGPAPYFRRAVPIIIAERLQLENRETKAGGELQPRSREADDVMRARFGNRRDVTYISFLDSLCERSGCELATARVPLHFDTVHFTAAGSAYYGQRLAATVFGLIR